ncbi:MAG: sensor histidine kinase [Archangiaceae bacterium]|nr:sensor histidine kinase [Archangiaceae bacterium]
MRLSKFINMHHDEILDEWVRFARGLLPWATGLNDKALRDHADELLSAVVVDMESPQSTNQQAEKSKGHAAEGKLGRVGQKHATERLKTGLKLDQLVAEYRALRATVLRLWDQTQRDKQGEITRFNEAIDETLAEAANWYAEELSRTREQFLAVLGHDLRNPLAAIIMGASTLTRSETMTDQQARVATRILNSGERMNRMVNDLLDLTRTRLGSGIPIITRPMNLTAVCQQVIAELEAAHPDCELSFESKGELEGEWDSDRLTQVLSNLVANAVQHGGKGGSVRVVAAGAATEVVVQVINRGPVIPMSVRRRIFEPMVREQSADPRNIAGLGLGLYIAHEIVASHLGRIQVSSNKKQGTTFSVHLPRHAPKTPAHAA